MTSFRGVLRQKEGNAGVVFICMFLWAFSWAQEQSGDLRSDLNMSDNSLAGDFYFAQHPTLYTHTSSWIVNPFDQIPRSLFYMDSVTTLRGVFDIHYEGFDRWAEVTGDWTTIVIYESQEGLLIKIPFAAPVSWYFQQRINQNRFTNFYKVMATKSKLEKKKRGQKVEVFGLDTEAGRVSLNLSGNISITGKMVFQDQDLARSSFREAQTTHLEFDERQQLHSEGKIGDRVSVFLDWDSERDFDWENNIRIHYTGKEDEIIQKIEAGNVSLSLPSTQFVSFSGSSKGLFGIKSIMKLGPVDITSIASIEQTKKEKKEFKGGAEAQGQTIPDYQYRKNQYFFIDQIFRDGGLVLDNDGIVQFHSQDPDAVLGMPSFYPLDSLGRHELGNVVVSEIEVFKGIGVAAGSGTFYGLTYVDPVFKNQRWQDRNPENADTTNNGFFQRLVRNVDYIVSEDLGFIRLTTPAQIEKIAVSYQLSERKRAEQDPTVIIKNVGELTFDIEEGDTIHLKLIKPDDPRPSHPTWPLAFKNVYYLGASNINQEGFTLDIIFKNGTLGDNIWDENGNTFLHLFGLDDFDENGGSYPDDLVDLGNPNILSLTSGELIFPMLYPFELDSLVNVKDKPLPDDPLYRGEGNLNPALKSILPDSALIYRGTVDQQIRNQSKFDIKVAYQNTSSTINLGGFMLVEGSEEVRLNGNLLQKDKDYLIDYFTGTLTFLTDAINDPSADLEILYDKHELVSFDKKTIVGARAQMDLGKKSFLGMTALFYNQSVINEKIEVGYEPTKNFIWDINGRYESEINLLTQAIDKLPLIETTKPSLFTFEGEFAQVLPNPNPIDNVSTGDRNGVAYIDDFEGAKRTTSPSISRRFWHRSAVPIGFNQKNRARLFWYNPFTQYRTKDIWPNLDTGIRAGNELTDILRLNYKRRESIPQNSLSWAGITSSFYTSDYNQTGSKFFEIWLLAGEGEMTIDLGFISEDQNHNNSFDTEDKAESGLSTGNTILEEKEDIGLDGCEDQYEDGYGGCLPNGFTYENAPDSIKYTGNDVNPDDPNEDNWYYDQNNAERPKKYRFINGTEQNGFPPAGLNPLEGALYPDTEDINRNGTFDIRDDYFTFTFDLDTTSDDWNNYQGGFTETGWRLYRIPLSAFQKARKDGDITWDTIKFMRLVLSGIEDSAEVWIAKVEMVGNEWQELGVRSNLADDYVIDDSVFAITIVNTDDNLKYAQSVEEIGVQGEYDRLNEVRLKEQSLVLKFTDLMPGREGAAQKNLMELRGERAQSYLTYKKLKLFTYGASDHTRENSSDVEFFIRFGRAEDYYELRQPVFEGWDSKLKRNYIEIDLDFFTELKLLNPDKIELPPYHSFTSSDTIKKYIITSEDGDDTLKQYLINRAPALSRLQYFIVGVRNTHPDSAISGEVWIDELRLSGVRKDVGSAFRIQSKLQLADVGNVTVSYNRKDADFHVLQKRLGSGRTSEKFRIDSRISIDKLFPRSWGLKLPLNLGFTNNVITPKYIPGTDILLNEDAIQDSVLEEMLTLSKQISLTTSFSKSTKSDRLLTRYTLDKIKVNFSGSHGLESNEQTARRFKRNYNGGASYNLPFGRNNYISPLKFLKNVPWLGEKVGNTHLYYTPSSVDLSANVSETFTETTPRVGIYKEIYNMGLSRNFKVNYGILENLKSNYNKTIKSDMDQFRAKYLEAVKNLSPGIVSDVTENLTTTFNPGLSSWFKPSLNYSSNYHWSKPVESTQEGANIQSQRRFSSSVTLTPKTIIETVYTPPKKSRPTRRRGRTRVAPTPSEPEKKEKKEPKNKAIQNILKGLYEAAGRINPVSITYSENRSQNAYQVLGSPDITYRFGFVDEFSLEHSEDAGVNRGSRNIQRDFSIRSGLNLIRQVTTTFNFSNNRSISIDGNNVRTKSQTRDFFPRGVKGNNGFPMVGWNVRISGVEKWPLINMLSKSATFEHAFSGKESQSWQNKSLQSSKYTASYSPLAGFSMTLVKNISLSTRYSIVNSVDNRFSGINSTRVKKDRTFTTSTNYSHRGGLRIPIFFFRDFNLENTINFTLSLDFSDSKTRERNNDGVKLTTTGSQKSWKISPRLSYSFTRRVTGGIWYEYRESKSKVVGRKIDRDFGFEVNIAIQG